MAMKLTFEKRVEDAQEFVVLGEIKKAISTLKKALVNDPEKDTDSKVANWIVELEEQVDVAVEEKVDTNVKVVKKESKGDIDFQIIKPMNIAGVLRKHPEVIKLPRSYKNLQGGFLIAVEDME